MSRTGGRRDLPGSGVAEKTDSGAYRWEFQPRFRRHAFGWRSQLPIQRIKEAVSEIKKVAGRDPVLAGEGAVVLLERLSPALEHVDSSSGAIGTAVNNAISVLVPLIDEAYVRYGLRANQAGTYLATYRVVAKKYPHKKPADVLADLVATTPGQEAKWFAAAKDIGLYDEALALAQSGPCDPRTLTRAARDLAERQPEFAAAVGLLALERLAQGYGYDITGADVWAAYQHTMKAAELAGRSDEVRDRIRQLAAGEGPGGFVTRILAPELHR